MNQPSQETIKKMLLFFGKTSVPRILREKREQEKLENQNHKEVS